jgi:iron complex outermembrane receptor protein
MRRNIFMASVAVLAMGSTPALAQSAAPQAASGDAAQAGSNQLAEIVVTAQKRAENIQSVPLSIMSVGGEALARAGVNDPVALQKLVPTLQINNTLFGSGVVIRIRGFGSAANTAVDSEVASYLDGAYVPRPGALLASFLDVKNVEVLSGPQGTLFGRNATLGAISINTNDPSTAKTTVALTAEASRFSTYNGTAVVNVPVSDSFAVRFAVKGSHTDGMFHNQLDGRTYGRSDGVVMRLSTKLDISPNLHWVLRGDYTKTDGDGVFPETVYTSTADPSQLAALTSFITRNGGTAPVYSNKPSYTVNQYFPAPFLHDRQYGITSNLNWDVTSQVALRLIDSYRDWRNDQLVGDTVATSLNMLNVETLTRSKAQSHELQLVSAKNAFLGSKLGLTAGLYYAREEYSLDTGFNLGSQFCSVVLARSPATIPVCASAPQTDAGIANFAQLANSYAAYVQGDYEIFPALSLTVGVRHTWDRKTGSMVQSRANAFASALITPSGPDALSFSDDRTSVRASLSWKVTDRVMAFATFSTGYKSGGFNSGASPTVLTSAQRTFASETADDYEVGVKSEFFGRRARVNLTLFDTELSNFQDRSFDGTGFLIRNSGDVRSRGVDVDGQLLIVPRLKATFGGTYLDSIYKSNTAAPGLEGCVGAPGCATVQNLTGQPLGFAPKVQGNVGLEWTSRPVIRDISVAIAASEHFTSSFLTANTDNPQSRLPGYATTDLRLTFQSGDGRWKFDLFGTNVFDKHYLVTTVAQPLSALMGINNTTTGATIFRGFLGSPATYGLRVSLNF